ARLHGRQATGGSTWPSVGSRPMLGGGDGGAAGTSPRRRNGFGISVAVAAVVLVAMVAAGARVPLATEGSGGWDLFIPNLPPPAAIEALLDRYRTARYSHHRLDEHDRAVAMDALREIRAAIVGAPA